MIFQIAEAVADFGALVGDRSDQVAFVVVGWGLLIAPILLGFWVFETAYDFGSFSVKLSQSAVLIACTGLVLLFLGGAMFAVGAKPAGMDASQSAIPSRVRVAEVLQWQQTLSADSPFAQFVESLKSTAASAIEGKPSEVSVHRFAALMLSIGSVYLVVALFVFGGILSIFGIYLAGCIAYCVWLGARFAAPYVVSFAMHLKSWKYSRAVEK
jgi:ABC-type transport system involved in cytochrome bd biosynthesis fused ATPase/permease subunit